MQHFKEPFTKDQAIDHLSYKYSNDIIIEAWEEIDSLVKEGLLFSPEISNTLDANKNFNPSGIKALCLHVAHDCNLVCHYCFASKGTYKVQKNLMSEEIAKKAVDFLLENSGKRKNVEIDFFGGEPLLNFEVVKKTVEYGRSIEKSKNKNIHFTITTNGYLLDDKKINYINKNMDNVVISIDGRKEVHDSIRKDVLGRGTYEKILIGAKKLVDNRGNKDYFIRGTFTSKNLDFSKDVLHLADIGFSEISIEPVVGVGQEFHIKKQHIPKILEEYEHLASLYVNRIKESKPFNFYHFKLDLYKGPCFYKRITACGAGSEYYAVAPLGDLYPCHQFVGEHQFCVGNLHDGIKNTSLSDDFQKANILTKDECSKCFAKLYCSGGCHANSYYLNNDILKPDDSFCQMQRKRIECAIMIEAWKYTH